MTYVEGFVCAVPADKKEAYRKHAADAAPLFREFGAARMVETWGRDVPDGKVTDFKGAVKAQDDEVVVFSWFEYPDKATRERANEKIMSDPRMKDMGADMPFDGQRMIYGGFEVLDEDRASGSTGYVDAMLCPVPADGREKYRAFAKAVSDVFRDYGAVRVIDSWEDDVPDGKVTDYRRALKTEEGEKIVYSWVEWPSKDVRDAAWDQVMKDPRMQDNQMPFDGKRMIYGGFEPIVDA